MIVVTHVQDDLGPFAFLAEASESMTEDAFLYLIGLRPPNYPLPAIRYHVDAGRTGVAIWNNSKYEAMLANNDDGIYCMMPDFEYP